MLAEFMSLDSRKNNVFFKMFSFYVGFWWRKLTKLEIKILLPLGKKKLIVSFSGTTACVFLLLHWSFLHWGGGNVSVSGHFRVCSVSLLIAIIVSKAFMSKACMVVSDISCHCIWTNTDYYKQTKKVPPCLIKILEIGPRS